MRVTYDRVVNAAYIYLKHEIGRGQAVKGYMCDPEQVGGMINLDFDIEGRLLGIEVLDASRRLPEEVLKEAEIIG